MIGRTGSALSLLALLQASGCSTTASHSNVGVEGRPTQADTRLLDAGAAILQSHPPISALNAYLDGFHFYSGRPEAQMEAHHYCAILSEELIQCVIYDGNVKQAKLMGVEYIVSERLFKELPSAEKALWHSHVHEVKSGQLVAPGIPQATEHALMNKLVRTYGKTWHTWHTDQQKSLPLGVPQLMMGFTDDGQLDPAILGERDQRFAIDSEQKRLDRKDIQRPKIDAGADAWQKGKIFQIKDPTGAHVHH